MGKKSRDKGIGGELEAAKHIKLWMGLTWTPERILDQTRGEDNGLDLKVFDWGIQVKRHKVVTDGVIRQGLCEAEDSLGDDVELFFAVCLHRADRGKWLATMRLGALCEYMTAIEPECYPCARNLVTMRMADWCGMVADQEAAPC